MSTGVTGDPKDSVTRPAEAEQADDPGRRRAFGMLLALAMVTPPLVAIVAMAGRTWHPADDLAIIDLRVRDAFTTHPSLTGLFSRPGWNHPGPALFWLIAPVSTIFGQAPWATRVGGAVIDLGAMVWLAWITWRAGIRTMLTAAAVVGMTYLAIGPWVLRQPWNLHIPLVALPLVLFLALRVATGSTRHLIGFAIAATIVVQTHIGFVVPVLTALVGALACVAIDARREHHLPARWRSTLAWTGSALAVLWVPPLVETIANWPGNLGKIAGYFARGAYEHVGFSQATGIMAGEFRFLPPWLGGGTRLTAFTNFAPTESRAWLLVPAALIAVGIVAAWRSGRSDDRRTMGIATALLVTGIFAISRADEPRAYTFEWRVVVAALVTAATVRAGSAWCPPRRIVPAVAGALAVAVACWGAIDLGIRVTDTGTAQLEARARALATVLPKLRAVPSDRRVLVRPWGPSLRSLFDGVINELDREGVDVRVDPELARIFGGSRRAAATDVDEIWYVTEDGSTLRELLAMPGARVVASTSPLGPSENAELDRLQALVAHQLVASGHRDEVDLLDQPLFAVFVQDIPAVDRLAAYRISVLNDKVTRHDGCRCAIVAIPGGRDPASSAAKASALPRGPRA